MLIGKQALALSVCLVVALAGEPRAKMLGQPRGEWQTITLAGTPEPVSINTGKAAAFKPYDAAESFDWAIDIIFSPDRARDRQVMYAYKIHEVGDEFFQKLAGIAKNAEIKVAVINKWPLNLTMLGETTSAYGTPIKWTPEIEKTLLQADRSHRPYLAMQIIFKTLGATIGDEEKIMRPAGTYIAISERILGVPHEKTLFVTNKGAWPMLGDIKQ